MGFACWGRLGQPLPIERLAPQRSNATRCSDAGVVWKSRAVWGEPTRALASDFDAQHNPSMSIDSLDKAGQPNWWASTRCRAAFVLHLVVLEPAHSGTSAQHSNQLLRERGAES